MKLICWLFLFFALFLSNTVVSAEEIKLVERSWDGSLIRQPVTEKEYAALIEACKEARKKHCGQNYCNAVSDPSCPYDNFQPPPRQ